MCPFRTPNINSEDVSKEFLRKRILVRHILALFFFSVRPLDVNETFPRRQTTHKKHSHSNPLRYIIKKKNMFP